jgi:hypothetical protein
MTELEQVIRAETNETLYERGYGSQRFGELSGVGKDVWILLLILAALFLISK